MRRSDRWFEFAGRRSDAFGIAVIQSPGRVRGAERGKWIAVPGRDGALFRPDGGREDTKLAFLCTAPADRLADIAAWLCGSGWLIDGDRPDAAYKARPSHGYTATPVAPGASRFGLTIAFQAAPLAYLWPKQTMVCDGPTVVGNPGKVEARPVLHIRGSGPATVSMGGALLVIDSVPATLTVDSESQIAYSGTTLKTASLTGNWPTIPPEGTTLSWTGGITQVTLECNYRWP